MSTPKTELDHEAIIGESQIPQLTSDFGRDQATLAGEDQLTGLAKFRSMIREPAAEFLGTMLLVLFGLGVNCQATLSTSTAVSSSPKGDPASAYLAWGVGLACGVWVSAGISGGHINPAVTLTQVVFRGFPLWKFPIYVLAQVSGAFFGALIVYGNYSRAIHLFEGGELTVPGTAGLFGTYPLEYMSNVDSFFSEFLATAIFLLILFAVTDKRNCPPPAGLLPIVIFFIFLGVPAAFGMQTSFAMNPARDFGPRLMTAIFYGRKVWSFRNQYWIWTPILGTFTGALAGAGIYDLLIYTGSDSPFNRGSRTIAPTRQRKTSTKTESMV